MAINPYDQAVWSQYTPLSAQEILQPAMIMGERQMQLENEYAALGDTASQLAFIAETETDPNIKAKYTNYMNQINQGINTLRDRGINPNTRAQMLDLKSKFQSELAPIKAGYELKLQDVTNHNQMRMKDPTWIGIDPNSRSVSDYINNGLMPMATEGISGAMVTAQAAEMAKGYQHILNSDNPTALMIDQFGPQYQEFRRGLSPETDDFEAAMQYIENTILGASASQLDWARDASGQLDANVANQLSNSVRRGMNNAMGKSEVLRDSNREFKMKQQLQREAAREAALNSSNLNIPEATRIPGNVSIVNNARESFGRDRDTYNTNESFINAKSYSDFMSGNLNTAVYPNLNSNNTTNYNLKDFNTYKKAFQIIEATKDMSKKDRDDYIDKELGKYINTGGTGNVSAVESDWSNTDSTISYNNAKEVKDFLDMRTNKVSIQLSNINNIPNLDSREYSKEDRTSILEADVIDRSVKANSAYIHDEKVVDSREATEALRFTKDLRTSGAQITIVDSNGRTKVYNMEEAYKKLKPAEIDDLVKVVESDYVGRVPINDNIGGSSSYRFKTTKDKKDYYIDVPSNTLTEDYAMAREVNKIIESGISGPTDINVNGETLRIVPNIQGGRLNYTILMKDENGSIVSTTLDGLIQIGNKKGFKRYFDKDQTRTEVQKQKTE